MKESELKQSLEEYLSILEKKGILYWDRLNSGEIIALFAGGRRRIKLCRPGTFDYMVLIKGHLVYVETKGDSGKLSQAQYDFMDEVLKQGAWAVVIKKLHDLYPYLCHFDPRVAEVELQ